MIFAKLFERDGNQVLVTLDEVDPGIVFKFEYDELYISPKLSFNAPNKTEDEQWERALKAFEKVDEEFAFNLRDKTINGINLL